MKKEKLTIVGALLYRIQSDLCELCNKYNISFSDVVRVGDTGDLLKLVLTEGFIPDEETFFETIPEMHEIENIIFTRTGSTWSLLFIKTDALYHLVTCCDDGDKLREFVVLKTRIEFSKLYLMHCLQRDEELQNNIFNIIATTKYDTEDIIKNSNSYEERARVMYDKIEALKIQLDSLDITREEFIRYGKLTDEILGFTKGS